MNKFEIGYDGVDFSVLRWSESSNSYRPVLEGRDNKLVRQVVALLNEAEESVS